MAEIKNVQEREYVIPLKKEWLKTKRYERTKRAIREIKEYIAKHMKVPDRDVSKVKLDVYFNNEVWFRGKFSPPTKVKVKATRDGDIVKVTFVEDPQHLKFLKQKHAKKHKPSEKKTEVKTEEKAEETDEKKKDEKEKETAVAQQRTKQAEQQAKVDKHITSVKEESHHRMALQK